MIIHALCLNNTQTGICVIVFSEENLISVWNNGMGIPVEMHAVEKMYVPQMIFGTLLTSSNYDDDQRKVTGGRNGYGAKLCNIFSTEFTVETASSQSGKLFKQVRDHIIIINSFQSLSFIPLSCTVFNSLTTPPSYCS